jgi:hypothetical protein
MQPCSAPSRFGGKTSYALFLDDLQLRKELLQCGIKDKALISTIKE